MRTIFVIWLIVLLALTGFGVWATYSDWLIDEAEGEDFSLREDSAAGRRRRFFPPYFARRPTGGGWGFGK